MTVIISFGISLTGILTLLALKHWDIGHSNALYQRVVKYLDRHAVHLQHFLKAVPAISRVAISHGAHAFVYRVSEMTLRAVRFAERKLLKFVNMVKGRGEINRKKGSASLFLTNITDEKNNGKEDK